jgi:hypothetical protein
MLNLFLVKVYFKKFPFGIIYQIIEKQIVVIAVMHLHKKPDYWKKR